MLICSPRSIPFTKSWNLRISWDSQERFFLNPGWAWCRMPWVSKCLATLLLLHWKSHFLTKAELNVVSIYREFQNALHTIFKDFTIWTSTKLLSGPDEIPTRLLKELAPYLAEAFPAFFQASINQGYHLPSPEIWGSVGTRKNGSF
jgi:hypothetical protein